MIGVAARARGTSARQRAGLVVHAAAAMALIPAFILIAPRSTWDPLLLVALGVLAIITDRQEVPLPSGVGFDALMTLMLIAVALAGPLPAMEIIVLPWLANVVTGREPPLRAGALANLAGYGWQAIAAALVLEGAGVHTAASTSATFGLLAAGITIYCVGWAVGPAIYGTLWVGHPLRALVRSFVDMAAAGTVMIVLGAATVVLSGPLGLAALVVFAVIVVLPQSFLTYAARTRPVARLPRHVATRRYADAIAVQLGFTRAQRRHLRAVAAAARQRPPSGDVIGYARATLRDGSAANCDAQLATEWWNGCGGPLGLCAEQVPVAARVLAVAAAWSALTASGTPQLAHCDALAALQSAAGARLDPLAVRAARTVVAQERVTAAEPAPEPRLHRLRLPSAVRRALAAA